MFSSQNQVPADCLGHNEMYAALRFLSFDCRHQQRLTNWSAHLKAAAIPPRSDTLINTGKVGWRGVIGCGPDPCNFERQSMSEAGHKRRFIVVRAMSGFAGNLGNAGWLLAGSWAAALEVTRGVVASIVPLPQAFETARRSQPSRHDPARRTAHTSAPPIASLACAHFINASSTGSARTSAGRSGRAKDRPLSVRTRDSAT